MRKTTTNNQQPTTACESKLVNQQKVWNEIAPHWNEFRTRISPTVEKFLTEQKGNILDLGSGSGRNFMNIKNQTLYATDFSKEMIKLAKEKAKELNLDPKNILVVKSSSQPFEDNFFDAVLCFAVLHCIETKEERIKTLKEIHRILKPKGQALISSWGTNSPRLKNKQKECRVPWTIKEKTKIERYTYVYDLDELTKEAKSAGFKILNAWEERNVNIIVQK